MPLRKLGKSVRIFLFVCLTATFNAVGQPNNPNVDPDTVPISGLEILLGAGALLGLRRLMGKKKEE